uniref:DUF4834 family protein n=1 Tax=Flavobacterium sp. TaxID=239 RepID=UPI00404B89A7
MIEASFVGTLRTVLIIIVCYYILKFVLRLLAPYLLKKAMEKATNSMNEQFKNQTQQQQSTNNETTDSKSKTNNTKKVGEYIDFEEIE